MTIKTHKMFFDNGDTDPGVFSTNNSIASNAVLFYPVNGADATLDEPVRGATWNLGFFFPADGKVTINSNLSETGLGGGLNVVPMLTADNSKESIFAVLMGAPTVASGADGDFVVFNFLRNNSPTGMTAILAKAFLEAGNSAEILITSGSGTAFFGVGSNEIDLSQRFLFMCRHTPEDIGQGNLRAIEFVIMNEGGDIIYRDIATNLNEYNGSYSSTTNGILQNHSTAVSTNVINGDIDLYGAAAWTFDRDALPSNWNDTWFQTVSATALNWNNLSNKILPPEFLYL